MLMLIFQVAEQQFALNTEFIVEVLPALKLKQVHATSEAIVGLFNYQGEVVPVISMNQIFDEIMPSPTLKQRIILLRQKMETGKRKLLGLLVENIIEIVSISSSELKSDDNVSDLFKNPYLGKIFTRKNDILQCLIPDSILSDQEYHEIVSEVESNG